MQTEKIKDHFATVNQFTTGQLKQLLREINPEVTDSTLGWRINKLVKEQVIFKIGRGHYSLRYKPDYKPELTLRSKRLINRVKGLIALDSLAIWETTMVLDLILEQRNVKNYTLIMVPKKQMEPLFKVMLGFSKKIFLNPDQEVVDRYVVQFDDAIIILPLISEMPLVDMTEFASPTLEALLVNFEFWLPKFFPNAITNLEQIYKAANERYNINTSRLLRYATRRDKRERFENITKKYTP